MATLEILRRSEKCRQGFPLVPDAPCNSAIINPATAVPVSTTRSSSLGTRTSAESHSFVGTGNWGHRVLCNTTSHSLSQKYYLFVSHKYCLHMKILLAVRDYCIFLFYLLEQIFFRNNFFPQGNRSSVSQTAEILLQITEALMFLHTLHYLHCRYPLSM